MCPPNDSDEIVSQMKAAFRAAAECSTGIGKPRFERLSKAFNAYQEAADALNAAQDAKTAKIYQDAEEEFRLAMDDVVQIAKTDRAAAVTYIAMNEALGKIGDASAAPKPQKKHWHG